MTPDFLKRYVPGNRNHWQGRSDGPEGPRLHEIIQCADIREKISLPNQKKAVALVGFACDEGIKRNLGRPGAKHGPNAFRKAVAKLPVDPQTPYIFYDFGDITCEDQDLECAQRSLGELVAVLLERKILPLVVGGGHELAWGAYQGIAAAYPKLETAIVNFDAHFDLRPLDENKQGSSGTSFSEIANLCETNGNPFNYTCIGIQKLSNTTMLFKNAEKLKVHTIRAEEIYLEGIDSSLKLIDEIIKKQDRIFLSICLDVFAAAFAPGVSAPQPLGLCPWQIIPSLEKLGKSGKVVVLVMAELSPPFDRDEMTANLSASLMGTFLGFLPNVDALD